MLYHSVLRTFPIRSLLAPVLGFWANRRDCLKLEPRTFRATVAFSTDCHSRLKMSVFNWNINRIKYHSVFHLYSVGASVAKHSFASLCLFLELCAYDRYFYRIHFLMIFLVMIGFLKTISQVWSLKEDWQLPKQMKLKFCRFWTENIAFFWKKIWMIIFGSVIIKSLKWCPFRMSNDGYAYLFSKLKKCYWFMLKFFSGASMNFSFQTVVSTLIWMHNKFSKFTISCGIKCFDETVHLTFTLIIFVTDSLQIYFFFTNFWHYTMM